MTRSTADTLGVTRKFVSINEAGEILGLTPKTIRSFIAAGRIPASRLGTKVVRIHVDDLEAFIRPIPTADGGPHAA